MIDHSSTHLGTKAHSLEQYLHEKMTDAHGVIYSSLESESQAPWSKDTWKAEDDLISATGATPWEILNYENCGMTTGAYLAALSYKWRVINDDETYARAKAAFRGLCHVYQIGSQVEEGFFPKIYGGRLSHETSSDQYLYAIKGMRAWLPIAPPEDGATIRRMLPAMLDFWIRRDYRYDYFGVKNMPWPLVRFPSILYAAYSTSGESKYYEQAERINREHQVYLAPGESQILLRAQAKGDFSEYEKLQGNRYRGLFIAECSAMDIMELDECLLHSETYREHWLRSMEISWREGALSLTESGLAYACTLYDPLSGQSGPTLPGWLHEGPDPLGWSFLRWTGGFQVSRSTMLARVGVHVAKWLPELSVVPTILDILQKVDLSEMRHCIDPDGQQLLPRYQYMTRWVDADAIVNWLWAYWQGRYEGIIPHHA